MSIKSAKQIVDEAYAALLTKGDIDGFLAHFDENSELIEAESLPYAGHYHGKDAIRGLVQSLFTYWKDVDYDIERTVFDDEYVVVYGRLNWTSVKNDKRISVGLAEVWKIREGRVLRLHPIFGDTKLALDAVA